MGRSNLPGMRGIVPTSCESKKRGSRPKGRRKIWRKNIKDRHQQEGNMWMPAKERS